MRAARSLASSLLVALALLLAACAPSHVAAPPSEDALRERVVTATAYNSLPGQAAGDPTLTAFGGRLRPGMRVVAVSSDLEALGLVEGKRLTIEGFDGEWTVGDRMGGAWRERIDLYMGEDEEAALAFGKRRVRIRWRD
jgi:3D (Asp-Asp-Asp) domain-containing protein